MGGRAESRIQIEKREKSPHVDGVVRLRPILAGSSHHHRAGIQLMLPIACGCFARAARACVMATLGRSRTAFGSATLRQKGRRWAARGNGPTAPEAEFDAFCRGASRMLQRQDSHVK